jgi:hypothetical protein
VRLYWQGEELSRRFMPRSADLPDTSRSYLQLISDESFGDIMSIGLLSAA